MQRAETFTTRWRMPAFFLVVALLIHAGIFFAAFRHVVWPQPPDDMPDFSGIGVPSVQKNVGPPPMLRVMAPPLFVGGHSFPGTVSNIAPLSLLPEPPFSTGPSPLQVDPFPELPGAFGVPDVASEFVPASPPLPRGYRFAHPGSTLFVLSPSSSSLHVRFGDVRRTQTSPIPTR